MIVELFLFMKLSLVKYGIYQWLVKQFNSYYLSEWVIISSLNIHKKNIRRKENSIINYQLFC